MFNTSYDTGEVQVCTLLSIKTGGCTEDYAYCPQAARYNTGVAVQALMKKEEVPDYAAKTKAAFKEEKKLVTENV